MRQFTAFAFGVPHDINAFHYYTMSSSYLSLSLDVPFREQVSSWARKFDPRLTHPPTYALRPINPDNAWGLCITATAGTELVTSYSLGTLIEIAPWKKRFTILRPSSRTRRRSIRLSSIVEYSRLQPPVGVWTVSQFQCWGPYSHTPYPS